MKIFVFAAQITLMFLSMAANSETTAPEISERRLAKLQAASDAGSITSMVELAGHYLSGSAGQRDPVLAERLYRRAAALGDADAIFHLGNMYLLGDGVPKDEGQALRLFHKAANQGHPLALKNFESLKKIVEPDSLPALDKNTTAATIDEIRAIEIARKHGIHVDFIGTVEPTNAISIDESASDAASIDEEISEEVAIVEQSPLENPTAADPAVLENDFRQGEKYYLGDGFERDEAKAVTFFRRAARGGHPLAIERLLDIYQAAGIPAPRCGNPNVDNEICF